MRSGAFWFRKRPDDGAPGCRAMKAAVAAGVVWLMLVGGCIAETPGPEDHIARARSCFQNNGGPQGCPTVFGWCNAAGGFEARMLCRERMETLWNAAMEEELQRLQAILASRSLHDRLDGRTPVATRVAEEHAAWERYRDARCGWDLPAPEGNITSPEEARFRCREVMSRARAQQLWDLSLYLMTTPLP